MERRTIVTATACVTRGLRERVCAWVAPLAHTQLSDYEELMDANSGEPWSREGPRFRLPASRRLAPAAPI